MINKKMVSKKFLFIFVGMFFVLFFSGVVSAVPDIKVNRNGNVFNWCDGTGGGTTHDVEACGYSASGAQYFCDEGNAYSSNVGNFYYIVYGNHWYNVKCRGTSHGVGRHFANFYGGDIDPEQDANSWNSYGLAKISCPDNDGDGQVSSSSSNICKSVYPTDCNDDDAEIKVGGVGSCDCNSPGTGKKLTYFKDVDADGFGFSLKGGDRLSCYDLRGFVLNSEDCNDNDNTAFPGNPEIFDNKDNDCDGIIDEGVSCLSGATRPCGTDVGECVAGTQTCLNGQWGATCAGSVGPATEICTDNKDNNCNGFIDCTDSSCAGFQNSLGQKCEPLGETLCSDGFDNDGDVLKDYAEDNNFCIGTYWASDSLGKNPITTISPQSGDKIYLVLAEPGLTGSEILEIYEDDGGSGDDLILTSTIPLNVYTNPNSVQKNAILTWTITQTDINKAIDASGETYPLKFYFKTKNKVSECRGMNTALDITFKTGGKSSDFILLSHDEASQECSQIYTKNSCNHNIPVCNWMSYQSPILALDWTIVGGPSGVCGDGSIDSGEACDDGNTVNGDGCSSSCIIEASTISCSQYTLCSDANTEEKCEEANSCGIGPQNVNCADPNIECGCLWSSTANLCNSYSSSLNPTTGDILGTCTFQENEITSCENSDYYEYSTTATWSGAGTAEAAGCIGGTVGPIVCSAKTKLPLESKFGILLTILAIIGIYFLFYRKTIRK